MSESQSNDRLYDTIAVTSRSARTIYALYLTLSAFCILTVFNLSDRQILFNEPVGIPQLGSEIGIIGFFLVASVALISVFIYLNLYIHKIHRLASSVEGRLNKGRIYPWIINDEKFSSGSTYTFGSEAIINWIRSVIVTMTLWFSLPLTIAAFAAWSLKLQNEIIAYALTLAFVASVGVTCFFWAQYQKEKRRLWVQLLVFSFAVVVSCTWWNSLLKRSLDGRVRWATVDLSNQVLTRRGNNLSRSSTLNGARLNGAALRNTTLRTGDLERAYLNRTDLAYADLSKVNGTLARFESASMLGVQADSADFTGANFYAVKANDIELRSAEMDFACMDSTRLEYADLVSANMSNASLRAANLDWARIRNANLFAANLTRASLRGVVFDGANLGMVDMEGAEVAGARITGDYAIFELRTDTIRLEVSDRQDPRTEGIYFEETGPVLGSNSVEFTFGPDTDIQRFANQLTGFVMRLCKANSLFKIEPSFVREAARAMCPGKVRWLTIPSADSLSDVYSAIRIEQPTNRGTACDKYLGAPTALERPCLYRLGNESRSGPSEVNIAIWKRSGIDARSRFWGTHPPETIRRLLSMNPGSSDEIDSALGITPTIIPTKRPTCASP